MGRELAEVLVGAVNARLKPHVRTTGSLGQSDLGPLTDLASALSEKKAGALNWSGCACGRGALRAKEALAFVNSNAFTLGRTAVALSEIATLLDRFDEAAALTFEGMLGNVEGFDPAVGQARPIPGLADAIARMQAHLERGQLLAGGQNLHLQDPLTMRTVPRRTRRAGSTSGTSRISSRPSWCRLTTIRSSLPMGEHCRTDFWIVAVAATLQDLRSGRDPQQSIAEMDSCESARPVPLSYNRIDSGTGS